MKQWSSKFFIQCKKPNQVLLYKFLGNALLISTDRLLNKYGTFSEIILGLVSFQTNRSSSRPQLVNHTSESKRGKSSLMRSTARPMRDRLRSTNSSRTNCSSWLGGSLVFRSSRAVTSRSWKLSSSKINTVNIRHISSYMAHNFVSQSSFRKGGEE